ncbi:tripartite tricarboxylate transporter substrate binding protein [Pseudoruegeria sp. HB172150]|uniref:Bug family tripartite tricarboxylate transporter substrate binding protein n=1 Tax=Pseudoruegeria sp. HB172150 TaxID=2721164 RepID=UPI001557F59E|nr:tripartite tricarboxylate transporter substrate binding protein [Pseudoruegeria sp. HB172150]
MKSTRTLGAGMGLVLALGAITGPAAAQDDWPSEPIHFIIGYPAGSSPDTMGRIVAEGLEASLGQPVVIENKPGAGGAIGVQTMLQGDPAYTFGITTNGPMTTSPKLIPDLTYTVEEDIAPIALIGTSPLILTLNSDAEADTLEDFIAWAKSAPGEITYGSIGQGSGSHLTTELFAATAGVEMLHIPFASFAEVTNSILGQEINAAFMAPSGALAQFKAGNLKILGISSAESSPLAPDVPPIAGTAGMPDDFRAELWIAAIGNSETSPEIIEKLNAEIDAVLATDEAKEKMLAIGWQAQGGSTADLAERIEKDTGVWGAVLEKAGLLPN